MKYVLTLTILFYVFSAAATGEEYKDISDESFKENGRVKFFSAFDSMTLSLSKNGLAIIDYNTNPNAGISAGSEVMYRNFGASFWKDIGAADKSSKYGATGIEGLQLYYFSDKLGFDFYYQDVTGFHMDDPDEFGLDQGEPLTVRNDLSVKIIGVNGYYCFFDDFSMMSAFRQGLEQRKSGGSLLVMASAVRYSVDSDFPLIPVSSDDSGKYKGFRKGEFYGVSLNPGYAHMFIRNNFYLSLMGFLGGGIMKKNYHVDSGSISGWGYFTKGNIKISAGYNSELLFGGGSLFLDSTQSTGFWEETDELSVDAYVYRIEVFAGSRF